MSNLILTAVAAAALFLPSPALAFEATITRVSPISAHPAGSVSKIDLAPIEGVPVAPPRAPASPYVAEDRRPASIPVPTPNPVAVSWCPSDIL
jgi:hypothetical protein